MLLIMRLNAWYFEYKLKRSLKKIKGTIYPL